ncbi:MAG: CYTH domain-containing protein [Pseudomonadota bacterium]|nr:CYTH domain-containing protein [Pseudomonadota bacterium]
MAVEIERKFLVTSDSWRAAVKKSGDYRQGYLAAMTGNASVRVRIANNHANLNIKSMTLGVTRQEYEYEIPLQDGREMLANLCVGPVIEKRRHLVDYGNHTWEIDVFEGDNAGLIVAEIELSAEDEPFELPQWAGKEVSDDERYYNVCLAQHPYKEWKDSL